MPSSIRLIRPIPRLTERDEKRFWVKVMTPDSDGHMLWLGKLNWAGYGQFRLAQTAWYGHRVSYALAYGQIPSGLVIDHVCRVRHCVAPLHLEAVTQQENLRRSRRAHCKRGHLLDASNAYIRPDNGIRQCRACAVVRRREGKAS